MSEVVYWDWTGLALDTDVTHDNGAVLAGCGHFYLRETIRDVSPLVLGINRFIGLHHDKTPKPPLVLHINSDGGFWQEAISLLATLDQARVAGFNITTIAEGYAHSCASLLLQVGQRRLMYFLAEMCIHDAKSSTGHVNERDRRAALGHIENARLMIASIYAQRNTRGHNDSAWWLANYMDGTDHNLLASDALHLGLIDEIVGGFPAPAQAAE